MVASPASTASSAAAVHVLDSLVVPEPTSVDDTIATPLVGNFSSLTHHPKLRGGAAAPSASCKGEYSIAGGSRPTYRGTYHRGPVSMSCSGEPVYIQSASSPSYMYMVPSTASGLRFPSGGSRTRYQVRDVWHPTHCLLLQSQLSQVTRRERQLKSTNRATVSFTSVPDKITFVVVNSCQAKGYIHSASNCSCPETCRPPSGCSISKCGVDTAFGAWLTNTGKTTPTTECPASVWCPSFVQVY